MPTYSYMCRECKNKFEVNASIQEKEEGSDKFNCPQCKSGDTKPTFSLKSFFPKGNGKGGGCCGGGCGCK